MTDPASLKATQGAAKNSEPMIEDAELLRRYSEERDEDAFAELVRRHLGFVYHAALRQCGGDAHRAEDVAQAVFTDLARKATKLARRPVLAGWLYTSTRYAAAQAVRGEARRQARELEAQAMNEMLSDNNAASTAEWERLRPAIDDALHALDERDREAVLLRFFEGRAFADVGAKLFLSEDAARMRVERALEKMRAVLARRGVTSTSSALAAALAQQAAATAPAGLAANVIGAALASADLTAASALGLLQFMSTTKFALGTAAIIGFLALGTAGYNVRVQREAQASLATANQDYAALLARLRGVEQRATAAEQAAAQLKERLAAAQAKTAADAEGARAAAAWDPVVEGNAFLQRHPGIAQAKNDLRDGWTNFRFGPLFKSLGLTPAQIEEFHALTRGGWRDTVWIGGKVELGGTGKTAVLSYEAPVPPNEVNNRLRTLLGPEGLKKYYEANQTISARYDVHWVATALCFTDTPVMPQQADQLIQIITNGNRQARFKPTDVDWEAIEAKERGVLSTAQLPAWESLLTLKRAKQALDMAERLSPNPTPAK